MELTDFSKDVRKLLLSHWTLSELKTQLQNPEYFFEQVVIPRMSYLRRQGAESPIVRIKKTPTGGIQIFLNN